MTSVWSELKRRNVVKAAAAYAVVAWLLIEVASTVLPTFNSPEWVLQTITFVIFLGFPLALVFAWAFELTPEGIKRETDVERSASITRQTGRKLDLLIIGVLSVAVVYFAVDRFFWTNVETPEVGPVAELSLAVLPFVDMSPNKDQEYFADGISEELLNVLAQIGELRVIGRTSSFAFKGLNEDLRTIGEKLDVAYVLEGSVRKSGQTVRITAQLINTDDGYHLWSESYDRQLGDIFAIQDDIAKAVVDALRLTLLGETPQIEPINSESYVLYLQAAHVGAHLHAEALEQSNAMLKKVLVTAPDYAKAWRLLARNYAVQVLKGLLPRDEGNALVREAISRALTIDPALAEAHSWLAVWEADNGGDLKESAKRLQHALKLEPDNYLVMSHAAGFLSRLGRLDETIAIREYELSIDPLSPIVHFNLAWSYLVAGRPDEAIAKIHALQMLSPEFYGANSLLCWALLSKGDYDGALQAIQRESSEKSRSYGLVTVYHAMGRSAEADNALSQFIEEYGQDDPYSVASLLAYRGEIDQSFAWLDKLSSDTNPPSWIVGKMWYANLYDDARWLPFLESIGRSPEQLNAIDFKVTLPE